MKLALTLGLLVALGPPPVALAVARERAEVRVVAVHLGVNEPPTGSSLPRLRYADDDAIRFHAFTRGFAHESHLFSVLDRQSQRLHPELPALCRPPRRVELESDLAALAERLRAARLAGHRVVVYFSYSGHGLDVDGDTRLAVLDGELDRAWLERHVLSLPADAVHLFLDACHAEGLVTGRGPFSRELEAQTRPLDEVELSWLERGDVLTRHPHAGALLAASLEREAHEWSRLRSGVFTHALLSALAGGADVNGDGRLAYSEVAAFLAAAQRGVGDPRAAPRVVSLPPRMDRNAPILDLAWLREAAFLEGRPGALGRFYLEAEGGERVLSAHAEPGVRLRLRIPAGVRLWLRAGAREASFVARPGQRLALAELALGQADEVTARGALASALERGLFAEPFGPAYYRGWVDREGEPGVSLALAPAEPRPSDARLPAQLCLVGGGLMLGAAAVFAGLAIDARLTYDRTQLERPAREALERSWLWGGLAGGAGALALGLGLAAWAVWPEAELAVSPAPTPDGLGLTLLGRF
jgi:hypothetical protein